MPERRDAHPQAVRPPPEGDARDAADDLRDRERTCGQGGRDAAVVVEQQDEEAKQAEVPLEQRERNGSDGAAEWNRHLADAERESAFLLPEPRHHRSALAVFTPAASPPATASATTSVANEEAYAAQTSAPALAANPAVITMRSPTMSATMPQTSSVTREPETPAASTTPVCVSVRSKSRRIAGP